MHDKREITKYNRDKILKHFCIDLNATQTALLTEINRNTINKYYNNFRIAIYYHQVNEFKKFVGDIELDESYFGASRIRGYKGKLKRGRGTQKQPVFGIFLRKGHVYTEIIPDCKKKTLQGIIRKKIDIESVIYSDGWRGYNGLVDVGYNKHYRVNHSDNEFARDGNIHINGIESFWSFTKRGLKKFNGVKVNFDLHLKECEWRWQKDVSVLYSELKQIYSKYLKY